jgi:hypothetical protein
MNKDNLTLLANYLEDNVTDEQFDMSRYSNGDRASEEPEHICGTVACALGWAPLIIPPEEGDYMSAVYNYYFDYEAYSKRVFNLTPEQWLWCFDGRWSAFEPTVGEAVARIRRLIETDEIGVLPRRMNNELN